MLPLKSTGNPVGVTPAVCNSTGNNETEYRKRMRFPAIIRKLNRNTEKGLSLYFCITIILFFDTQKSILK
jgi:hypothetical protein